VSINVIRAGVSATVNATGHSICRKETGRGRDRFHVHALLTLDLPDWRVTGNGRCQGITLP
jgi:hypothetical protein